MNVETSVHRLQKKKYQSVTTFVSQTERCPSSGFVCLWFVCWYYFIIFFCIVKMEHLQTDGVFVKVGDMMLKVYTKSPRPVLRKIMTS